MLAPIAYLTCEIKGRDLPSRLLIASHLLKRGYNVVVGQQWSMIVNLAMADAPKGAVLFKTANKIQAGLMANCAKAGHIIFASDEECLPADPAYYAQTTDPVAVEACNNYLAINTQHRDALLKAFPSIADKVVVTGTARVDVLKAARADRPKQADYILFNTGFGVINSIWGNAKAAVDMWINAGGYEPGPETTDLVKNRTSFERAALAETDTLLGRLIKQNSIDIVIRPHPGERSERWQKRYKSAERTKVLVRSDLVPWLQHARLMVHSESTTGIEAAIMGVPAINLSPSLAWGARYPLVVSDVNVSVKTAAQALDLISNYLSSNQWPSAPKTPELLFPTGGAAATAALLAAALPAPRSLSVDSWQSIQRTEVWKEKFTVSADEVAAHITGCTIKTLDDSLFLLTP